MFWCDFCSGHRILCIEWWLHPHIKSFRNVFAWFNDTIRTHPGVMFNTQHISLHSCLNLFHFRPICAVILSNHFRTLNLWTRIGTKNKCKTNMECIFLQLKCCYHSMVAVASLLFVSFTLTCGDETVGTASPLVISDYLYQWNLFWYHQYPYIPAKAKLYLQKPKCTYTVNIAMTSGGTLYSSQLKTWGRQEFS